MKVSSRRPEPIWTTVAMPVIVIFRHARYAIRDTYDVRIKVIDPDSRDMTEFAAL